MTAAPRQPTAIEKSLLGTTVEGIPRLLPGLLVAALLAWASIRLCEWVGCDLMGFAKTPISAVTTAILLGLILNNVLPLPQFLRPGLTFAVKKVLRLGIMMLGIRLSVFDALQLGADRRADRRGLHPRRAAGDQPARPLAQAAAAAGHVDRRGHLDLRRVGDCRHRPGDRRRG